MEIQHIQINEILKTIVMPFSYGSAPMLPFASDCFAREKSNTKRMENILPFFIICIFYVDSVTKWCRWFVVYNQNGTNNQTKSVFSFFFPIRNRMVFFLVEEFFSMAFEQNEIRTVNNKKNSEKSVNKTRLYVKWHHLRN